MFDTVLNGIKVTARFTRYSSSIQNHMWCSVNRRSIAIFLNELALIDPASAAAAPYYLLLTTSYFLLLLLLLLLLLQHQ